MVILVESCRDGVLSRTTTISGGGGCNALESQAGVHDGRAPHARRRVLLGTTTDVFWHDNGQCDKRASYLRHLGGPDDGRTNAT